MRFLVGCMCQAATSDAVGVFFVGVPVGSLTGADKDGQIAVSKGKVQAGDLQDWRIMSSGWKIAWCGSAPLPAIRSCRIEKAVAAMASIG